MRALTRNRTSVLAAIAAMAMVSPARAHHSAAMFDFARTNSAAGTIKTFRWLAPHSSFVIAIPAAGGQATELSLTSSAPFAFARQGFKPSDFKPGDKVLVSWHPSRSGDRSGVLSSIKVADGRTFAEGDAAEPGS